MAEERIRFTLGTDYIGAGMTAAENGVKNLAGTTRQALAPIVQLGRGIGMLDGPAGKAAGAVMGLVGQFKMFGPAAAAVSAAMMVINNRLDAWKQKWDDYAAAVKKAADNVHARLTALVQGGLQETQDALAGTAANAKNATASLNAVAGAAKAVDAAMGNAANAKADAGIVQLKLDALGAKIDAETAAADALAAVEKRYSDQIEVASDGWRGDEVAQQNAALIAAERDLAVAMQERAGELNVGLAEAEGALAVAEAERAAALDESAQKVRAASAASEAAIERYNIAAEHFNGATENLAAAREQLATLENSGLEDEAALKQARQTVTAAENALAAANNELTTATAGLTVSAKELEAAETRAQSVQAQQDSAVQQASAEVESYRQRIARAGAVTQQAEEIQQQITAKKQELAEKQTQMETMLSNRQGELSAATQRRSELMEQSAAWEKTYEAENLARFKEYDNARRASLDRQLANVTEMDRKYRHDKMFQELMQYEQFLKGNPFTHEIEDLNLTIDRADESTNNYVMSIKNSMSNLDSEVSTLTMRLTELLRIK